MTPFIIGNIQFTLSLLVYSVIAVLYVMPALGRRGYREAVLPLLLIHAFRYGPLTLLMPGQVDQALPLGVREVIAYGDLASALLAILAIVLLGFRMTESTVPVWIFTVVGVIDVITASFAGIQAGVFDVDIGFNLYILNFYVPMLIVSHVLIIGLLLRAR